jgi:hypothetical protein
MFLSYPLIGCSRIERIERIDPKKGSAAIFSVPEGRLPFVEFLAAA